MITWSLYQLTFWSKGLLIKLWKAVMVYFTLHLCFPQKNVTDPQVTHSYINAFFSQFCHRSDLRKPYLTPQRRQQTFSSKLQIVSRSNCCMIVTGNTKADWGLGVGLAYPLTQRCYITGTVTWSSSKGNSGCTGFLCKSTCKEGGRDVIRGSCHLHSRTQINQCCWWELVEWFRLLPGNQGLVGSARLQLSMMLDCWSQFFCHKPDRMI